MKKHVRKYSVLLLMLAGLATAGTGCNELLAGMSAGSFGLGYLIGRITTPTTTETQCFVNDVEVECSSLE